jgi:hypothetical protein
MGVSACGCVGRHWALRTDETYGLMRQMGCDSLVPLVAFSRSVDMWHHALSAGYA